MSRDRKTSQLQIRISDSEKAALKRQAKRAGMSMTDWVLSKLFPALSEKFQDLLAALSNARKPGFVLAELNDLLAELTGKELELAVSEPPRVRLEPYWANYVAAMIEHASARRRIEPPGWTFDVAPLEGPVFGTSLASLRLHLLTHSPPAFRRRNIFIDSSVGDRV